MKKIYLLCTLASLFIFTGSFAQYTKLMDLSGTASGRLPYGSLISDGTFLYGMTYDAGANGLGTVFKIMPDGSGFVNLLDFAGTANGGAPHGSLLSDGTFLYGLTFNGGANNSGTVFKIMPDGSGFVNLLDFAGTANGSNPLGSLISDGIFLYGTTQSGGANGLGALFKIRPDGSSFAKLLDFAGTANGMYPRGSLITDGTFLYGTTRLGGTNNNGTLFKIMPDGSGYVKLLDFANSTNGRDPWGSLITDGTFLYGMTSAGGANDLGTVFKIMPDGSGYLNLLSFAGTTNGKLPYGSLISDGTFLYGMTNQGGTNDMGTIFKMFTDGSGYAKLLDFAGISSGSYPFGSLLTVGTTLYGLTSAGGINGDGVVYKYALATGIDEYAVNTSFSISPNPTKDHFTIIIKAEIKNAQLKIYNALGENIYTENLISEKQSITTKQFSTGIYFVIVCDGDKLYSQKLIID